jgi:phage FluMu protein Com
MGKDNDKNIHRCGKCGQYLYVASGKGVIVVICPHCHKWQFFWVW